MCIHLPAHKHVHSGAPCRVCMPPPPPLKQGARGWENGTALWHKASDEGEAHEAAEVPSSAGTPSLVALSSSAVPVPGRSSSGPGCPSPLLTALTW